MWEWTIKKTEHQRIDVFELWCWRRLFRVPWTAWSSNQPILKISPGSSLVGLMLNLKLQYFGHLMQRADAFEKTLMLEKFEGRRRRGQQGMGWLDYITDSMDMGLGGLRELVLEKEAWRAAVYWVSKSRTWLRDWTELNFFTVLWWFLLYIDMNQPWVYMCPPSWAPPPTSHPIPSLRVIPVHQLWVPCFIQVLYNSNIRKNIVQFNKIKVNIFVKVP